MRFMNSLDPKMKNEIAFFYNATRAQNSPNRILPPNRPTTKSVSIETHVLIKEG